MGNAGGEGEPFPLKPPALASSQPLAAIKKKILQFLPTNDAHHSLEPEFRSPGSQCSVLHDLQEHFLSQKLGPFVPEKGVAIGTSVPILSR